MEKVIDEKNDYFTSYFNFLEDVMDISSKTNSIYILEGRSKTKTQHSFVLLPKNCN